MAKIREDSHYSQRSPLLKPIPLNLVTTLFETYGQNANFVVCEVVNSVYEDYEQMVKQFINLDYRSNLEQINASVLSPKYIHRTQ